MFLLVGLGNPGTKYAGNRHNIGFMAVDEIVRRHGFSPWRKKFHGEISEGLLALQKTLVLKPLTFMNESGQAVGEAIRFLGMEPNALASWLVTELERAGVARRAERWLNIC